MAVMVGIPAVGNKTCWSLGLSTMHPPSSLLGNILGCLGELLHVFVLHFVSHIFVETRQGHSSFLSLASGQAVSTSATAWSPVSPWSGDPSQRFQPSPKGSRKSLRQRKSSGTGTKAVIGLHYVVNRDVKIPNDPQNQWRKNYVLTFY